MVLLSYKNVYLYPEKDSEPLRNSIKDRKMINYPGARMYVNIFLILAHPNPHSFNHAIADVANRALLTAGHTVLFHDLYQEGFDPVLTSDEIPRDGPLSHEVFIHCDEIARADGIIVVHPNWWGMPPAIMKGWIDRVIRPGVAYRFLEGDNGEGVPVGLLQARAAIVFNTANTPEHRENEVFGDPLEQIWKDCVFGLCGVTNFYRDIFRVVVTSDNMQRKKWLDQVHDRVMQVFPGV